MYNAGLLPVYKAGFIDLNKQYLTIGLNGLNQAAEFLGIKCNDNKDYKEFCQFIFSTVKEQNTLPKTKKTIYNTEMVPAESLAVKNYN
jgi:ribonucleoside-triphosphate reductase